MPSSHRACRVAALSLLVTTTLLAQTPLPSVAPPQPPYIPPGPPLVEPAATSPAKPSTPGNAPSQPAYIPPGAYIVEPTAKPPTSGTTGVQPAYIPADASSEPAIASTVYTPAAPSIGVEITDATLIPLPKLSSNQIQELISDIVNQYRLVAGFRKKDAKTAGIIAPDSVQLVAAMTRGTGPNADVVVMGFVTPARRLPQLWVTAWRGDVNLRMPWQPLLSGDFTRSVQTLLTERNRILSSLSLSDLESKVLNLSYVDTDAALFALRAMGYAVITDTETLAADDGYKGAELVSASAPSTVPGLGAAANPFGTPATANPFSTPAPAFPSANPFAPVSPGGFGTGGFGGASPSPFGAASSGGPKFAAIKNLPTSINFDRLPLVVRLPSTEQRNMGLVGAESGGAGAAARDSLGLTVIPQAAANLTETITGGTAQLLVMYHPAYPEQFQRLRKVVRETIDRPARQVYVEGLVLEISSEALRDLGVKWDEKRGSQSLSLGTLTPFSPGDTALSFLRDNALNVTPSQIMARINALVSTNKAEVLSRPSVLTLDNRQATIRVGTDIPVATSKDASAGGTGSSRVAFSFQYLPTGILLNIRPRISEDGAEISMLIDATVSATVPNQDLRVLDPTTRVTLASAPTISTRRVQTYARIADNMPLIIGGLVSRDQISGADKVPIAGEIPLLGKLFGHENSVDRKREVIIVLTPSVVTENIRLTKAQYPRDDDRFDLSETSLFKQQYRIRAEDLLSSSYIRFNRRFLTYRDIANKVIERDPTAASRAPFSQFAGASIPAEFIFVSGMMSKLLDRIDSEKAINIDNIMLFERRGDSNEQRPVTLVQLLARYGDGKNYMSFFKKNKGKALALTYRFARNSARAEDLFAEPLPTIALVDCADREEWRRLLWDMNQSTGAIPQHTILIHEPDDLHLVQLAFVVQNTVLNNGGNAGMIFDKWLPGRMLNLQEVTPTWERAIMAPIAQYYFIGQYFTMYFMQEHERAIQALDKALRAPENATLVQGIALP